MTTIRVFVVVSVIVQAVVVALLFKTPVFPVACAVVALVSLFVTPRWQTTGRTISVASIVIAIGLTILWPVISPGVLTRAILLSLDVAFFVSFLALAMQTLLLFSVDEEKRALRTMLIGTMSLGCAGSLLVQAYSWDAYRIGSAAFVIICAVLLRVSIRNRVSNPRDSLFIRRLAVTVTVASALILATSTSVIVKRYQQELDMIFANMVAGAPPGVSMGFPSSSRLGSIASLQRRQGQETAIRVLSEHQPGYLRGRACDTYSAPDSRWLTTSADAPVVADAVLAGVRERDPQGRAAILLRRPASSNYERMDIWPVSDMGAVVFTRLDASDVAVDAQRIEVDADINVLAPDMDPALSYALSAGPPVAFPRASLDQVSADTPLDERGFQRLTAVPETIDPRIRELARSLFEGLTTTEEKIAAVVRYFRGNYTYQFGISVPPNEDPLTYFLIERPPAHCEYFASGAVILLRLGGIPARYVTGYVVHERNDIGDFWFARNRVSHACGEAYIDQYG